MAEIVPFPEGGRPDSRTVRRLLREAADDSEKLVYVKGFSENEDWYRLVTVGQVLRCLREGEVTETPSLDDEGNWRCSLYKLCGGVRVYVEVALRLKADRSLDRAYVLNVNNRIPT